MLAKPSRSDGPDGGRDAEATSWTIGAEEDGCALCRRAWHASRRGKRAVQMWPGVRRAGLPERLSPALTPGQRRRRRRLDLSLGFNLWPSRRCCLVCP